MPCYQPIRASQNATSSCRDKNPSCPRPPHNLSYCKDWSDRISDVKFWQSTTNADFAPPKARSVPNLLPMAEEDRLGPVCPPQRGCQDSVRTPSWGESVTRYDFKSPHSPGVTAKRAEKLSYYQRFMDDMCSSSHILDRVAEFGTLGGSITQYQDDFCQRLPTEDLQNRYRILVGCPPLAGNNVLSPYSTCGKLCNV